MSGENTAAQPPQLSSRSRQLGSSGGGAGGGVVPRGGSVWPTGQSSRAVIRHCEALRGSVGTHGQAGERQWEHKERQWLAVGTPGKALVGSENTGSGSRWPSQDTE